MTREYKVLITETLQKTVIVEAETEAEARTRVSDAWKNAEYLLNTDNFQGVEFHVLGEADGAADEKDLDRIESKGGGPSD